MPLSLIEIRVESAAERSVTRAVLDGASVDCDGGRVRVPLDAQSHTLLIWLRLGASEDLDRGERVA